MTIQTFPLGNLGSNFDFTGSILIDAALVVGGVEAYLRVVDLSGSSLRIETSATATGDEDLLGPELIPAWETNVGAIAFSDDGGGTLTLKGPNHADNTFQDPSEPYFWTPDNSSDLVAYWARTRNNLMMVLSDEAPPPVAELTLADSDDTGLEVVCKALLVASADGTVGNFIYQDSDRGGTDIPLDGELGLGDDDVLISGIRRRTTTLLQLNNNDNPVALDIGGYFDTGGAGDDLTIYLQTLAGGEISVLAGGNVNFSRVGQVRFTLDAAAQTLLDNLADGDRWIFKTARPAPVTPEELSFSASAGDPTASFSLAVVAPPTPEELSFTARAGDPTASFNLAAVAPPPVVPEELSMTARAGDPTASFNLAVVAPPAFLSEEQFDAWPYPVEWENGFTQSIQFRTEVLSFERGDEQRIAQRKNPRIEYRFRFFVVNGNVYGALARLSKNHGRLFRVPFPRGTVPVSSDTGSDTLEFDSVPDWISAGAFGLVGDEGLPELFEVLSVAGDTVTLVDDLSREYFSGTSVFRAIPARLNSMDIPFRSSRVMLPEATFAADPLSEYQPSISATPPVDFNGVEYFEIEPDWSAPPSVGFARNWATVDFLRGATDRLFPIPFSTRQMRQRYTFSTEAGIDRIIGLFYRAAGAQKAFWIPTWLDELRPSSNIASGATQIDFEGRDVYQAFANNKVYRKIRIDTSADQTYVDVSSISKISANRSRITLTSGIPRAVKLKDIQQMCWVVYARFETDLLEILWSTDCVIQTTPAFRTLEAPAP